MHDGNLHRKSAIIKSSRSFQLTLASAPSALATGRPCSAAARLMTELTSDVDFGTQARVDRVGKGSA
jgi:hypothetical protein